MYSVSMQCVRLIVVKHALCMELSRPASTQQRSELQAHQLLAYDNYCI